MYNFINSHPTCLIDEKRSDPSVSPPYYWHHVQPEYQRWAIREVWQRTPVGTLARALFDRGATDGEGAPNWVTHWLLYSVFRARDDRNNRNNRQHRGRRVPDTKGRGVGRVLLPFPWSSPLLTIMISSLAGGSIVVSRPVTCI